MAENPATSRPAIVSRRSGQSSSTTGRTVLALAGAEALRNGHNRVLIRCPSGQHPDHHPSASVRLDTGAALCFTCRWTARGTIELHAALQGIPRLRDAADDLRLRCGERVPDLRILPTSPRGAPQVGQAIEGTPVVVARWTYREADGTPAFEVERLQYRLEDGKWLLKPGSAKPKKSFRQSHPGGHPRRLPDRYRQGNRPLYRLPELIAASRHERLFIVEGEKAADALVARGVQSTSASGGAAQAHLSDWSPIAGRTVAIWPDHDDAGRQWLRRVHALLVVLVPPPRVQIVPIERLNLPRSADAVDWLEGNA